MQKNQNNPVHGKKSGKTEFQIESLLPVGKENAITTAELVKRSGCSSARELQQKIAYERNHGAVICSGSGKGYWKPKNRQEVWSSIFVTLMANKIGGLQFGIYRNCQISSRVFHTAVAALPLTKANRSDFE